MKLFTKLALLTSLSLVGTSPLNANLYRIDFNYGASTDGQAGTLSGFFTLNTALDTGNQIQTDAGLIDIPNWVTGISLTFTDSGGNATTTTSGFDRMRWDLKTGRAGNVDITADLVGQMDSFGFITTDLNYIVGANSFEQQEIASGTEFPLNSTATTPGGLPFLGLGALFIYYKKFQKKFNK